VCVCLCVCVRERERERRRNVKPRRPKAEIGCSGAEKEKDELSMGMRRPTLQNEELTNSVL